MFMTDIDRISLFKSEEVKYYPQVFLEKYRYRLDDGGLRIDASDESDAMPESEDEFNCEYESDDNDNNESGNNDNNEPKKFRKFKNLEI